MAPKNPDCNLEAGSISCLMITWTEATLPNPKYTLFNTPCQHCKWWDDYCATEEE